MLLEAEPAQLAVVTAPAAGRVPVSRRRGTRALMLLFCVLVAAGAVAGASGIRSTDTDGNVLRGFQIRVLSISQAAAENRMDGALAALQALERDLGDAAAAGRLSAARYRGIETALSAVRADLTRQVAAAAPAAPAAAEVQAGTPPTALADTATQNNPAPAPVEPVVPGAVPPPAPDVQAPGPQGQDTAKEAKGKGKGPGKP
ncbi:hypothetical protein [Pseudarthrobacter sp. NPDC080039]|uniref:hypothetical protein n=1 Tax=unclassified Pseudarthrobacter TaxID=2647000 RepID=UPI00344E9F4B